MNTTKDQIRSDMKKSPDQLQREADEVRRDMEQTVDQLANQFSPGELINQTFRKFQNGSGTAFVQNLSTQIQNNPIPALLAGVSLAWLMTASKRPPAQPASTGAHSGSGMMGASRDKLSSAAASTRDSGRHVVDGVKEKQQQFSRSVGDVKQRVSESSHHLMDSARSGAHSARSQYDHMLREQPLVLGMLAIAAGAALGAMLPRTETEDRTIGGASDEQKAALKRQAEGLKDQVEATVGEKAENERNQHQPQSSTSSSTDTAHGARPGPSTSPNATSTTHKTHKESQPDLGAPEGNPTAGPNHPGTNPPVLNPNNQRES